mmetsp:Transcript_146773/g.408874  ORF Transcript_146773/g.408874 Transcript_146773/m.408874 type:complete len:232 (-) Transcript_146773:158-853(-)
MVTEALTVTLPRAAILRHDFSGEPHREMVAVPTAAILQEIADGIGPDRLAPPVPHDHVQPSSQLSPQRLQLQPVPCTRIRRERDACRPAAQHAQTHGELAEVSVRALHMPRQRAAGTVEAALPQHLDPEARHTPSSNPCLRHHPRRGHLLRSQTVASEPLQGRRRRGVVLCGGTRQAWPQAVQDATAHLLPAGPPRAVPGRPACSRGRCSCGRSALGRSVRLLLRPAQCRL